MALSKHLLGLRRAQIVKEIEKQSCVRLAPFECRRWSAENKDEQILDVF